MKNYVKTISLCLGLASLTFAQTTTAPIYSASILAGIPTGNSIGNGGPSSFATVSGPQGIALDTAGNIYVADNNNNAIRKIDATSGVISNFVTTNVSGPNQILFDNKGQLWVGNSGDHRVLRISADGKTSTRMTYNGVTNTFGGDGNYSVDAYMNGSNGMAVDNAGNVYVADTGNNRIRMIKNVDNCINTAVTINGVAKTHGCRIYTIAGDGNAINPQVGTSCGSNNTCKPVGNNTVGDGGPAISARVNNPTNLAVTPDGSKLYISTTADHRIRVIDMNTGIINTVIGNCTGGATPVVIPCASGSFGSATGGSNLGDGKPASAATANNPRGLYLDTAANKLYFADSSNNRIRVIDLGTGIVNTVVGGGGTAADQGTTLNSGLLTSASLSTPYGVAVQNGMIYWVEQGANKVRVADPVAQKITTLVNGVRSSGSGGPATQAYLGFDTTVASTRSPRVAVDAAGNVYAVEATTHKIRKITADGIISDWAGTGVAGSTGDGGPAIAARLSSPQSVAFDSKGNAYIADTGNSKIRKVDTNGIITTVVGRAAVTTCTAKDDIANGTCPPVDKSGFVGYGGDPLNARLNAAQGVAVDGNDNLVIADTGNHAIRYVNFTTNSINTIAGGVPANTANGPTDGRSGLASSGFFDSTNALLARLNTPRGVAVDKSGNIFVAEWGNATTRVLVPGPGGYAAYSFYGSGSSSGGNPGIPTGTGTATVPGALRISTNDGVSIALDPGGNIYFPMSQNNRVNVITADRQKIYKVNGDGSNDTGLNYTSANAANLQTLGPTGVAVDSNGVVYVADRSGVIRKLVCTANCVFKK
jgi:streptogramin lyase